MSQDRTVLQHIFLSCVCPLPRVTVRDPVLCALCRVCFVPCATIPRSCVLFCRTSYPLPFHRSQLHQTTFRAPAHTPPSRPLPHIRSPSFDTCSRRRASRLSRIGKSGSRSSSLMLGSCSFRRMTEDLCSPNMSNQGYVMSSLSSVSISAKASDPTPEVHSVFAHTACR